MLVTALMSAFNLLSLSAHSSSPKNTRFSCLSLFVRREEAKVLVDAPEERSEGVGLFEATGLVLAVEYNGAQSFKAIASGLLGGCC